MNEFDAQYKNFCIDQDLGENYNKWIANTDPYKESRELLCAGTISFVRAGAGLIINARLRDSRNPITWNY